MITWLENIDRLLFLFLNGLNAQWLDPIMKALSSFWVWYPVVALFVYLLIKKFGKKFWIPLLVGIICFALTDQITNYTKKNVERYRPSHNTEISNKVHIVDNYRGGQYGFFSGHASNSFGLALISLLFLRNNKWTIFVLLWAVLVSYSRIYIGVHYPSDIFVGAAFGSLIAFVLFKAYRIIPCFRMENDCEI